MIRSHKLLPADYPRRVAMCRFLVTLTPAQLSNFLFSDEATFCVDGCVNSQNVRKYAPRKGSLQPGQQQGRPPNFRITKSTFSRKKGCDDREPTGQLFSRLSVTLMRGNAMMLCSRSRDVASAAVDGAEWALSIDSYWFDTHWQLMNICNKHFHTFPSCSMKTEEGVREGVRVVSCPGWHKALKRRSDAARKS